MRFTTDGEAAIAFVVALANTVPEASRSGEDELVTTDQLEALLDEHRYSGRRDRTARELADVRAERDRIRSVWMLPRDDAAVALNRMLAEARALPQLERHDGMDWHIHAVPREAPLAQRIRIEAAIALVDLLRADEWGRLRVCEAEDCDGLLADLSRNGSKRFCSVRCGNRVNMIAFRERRAEVAAGSSA